MSRYICHDCDIEFTVSRRGGTRSAFAEVCPVCQKPDALEYL